MCHADGCDEPVRMTQRGRVSKYCDIHQQLETRARNKSCKEPGCTKNPHYGVSREIDPRSKAEYCSGHKKDGMINIHGRKCKHRGCMKQPRFDYQRGKGKFCADHREPGMRDVLYKPCAAAGCMKHPHFGLVEGGPRYCAKHRTDDMVDVKHPRCHTRGCPELRMVGEDGHRAQWCAFHEGARFRTSRPRGREGKSQPQPRAREAKPLLVLPSHQEGTGVADLGGPGDSIKAVSPRVRRGSRKRKAPQWLEGTKVKEGDAMVAPPFALSLEGDFHSTGVHPPSMKNHCETESKHPRDTVNETGSIFLTRWDQLTRSSSKGDDGEGKKRRCSIGMALDEVLEADISLQKDISPGYKDSLLAQAPLPSVPEPKGISATVSVVEDDSDATDTVAFVDPKAVALEQWSFRHIDECKGDEDQGACMLESSQGTLTPSTDCEDKNYKSAFIDSQAASGAIWSPSASWAPNMQFPKTVSCQDRCQAFDEGIPDTCGPDMGTWSGATTARVVTHVRPEDDSFAVPSSVSTAWHGERPQAQHTNTLSYLQTLQHGKEWGQAQGQWLRHGGNAREPPNLEGVSELNRAEVPLLSSSSMTYPMASIPSAAQQPFELPMQSPSSGRPKAGFAPCAPTCYPTVSANPSSHGPAVSVAAAAAVAAASAAWAMPSPQCTPMPSSLTVDPVFPARSLSSSADVMQATGRSSGALKTESHHGNPLATLPRWPEMSSLFDANLTWTLKEEGHARFGNISRYGV